MKSINHEWYTKLFSFLRQAASVFALIHPGMRMRLARLVLVLVISHTESAMMFFQSELMDRRKSGCSIMPLACPENDAL